jgi:hypothetical protein
MVAPAIQVLQICASRDVQRLEVVDKAVKGFKVDAGGDVQICQKVVTAEQEVNIGET